MNRDCFIDYSSALVIAISGKRKRIGILLTALLFITLCPLQISTAALIDSNISAGTNLLARTQVNQTGSEEPINKKYLPDTRSSDSQRQRSRWRGKWLMASPSQQGFDSARLEKAISQIGRMKGIYSFILVRNGYIVVERYFREGRHEKPHNLKSASKSVLSALVGIAIDEGYMHLDQSIAELLPQIKTFDDPRKGAITVRHLLTMTSGLEPTSYQAYNSWVSRSDWVKAVLDRPMIYDPGTRFQYSTGNSHILSAILTATTGISTKAFAERKLFGPLNIKVQGWDTDPEGIHLGGNNLSLLPQDMAKFGQLFLDGGSFGSCQVVPKWWVDESTRASDIGAHDVYGAYGYYWYVRPQGEDAFVAVGYGGQYIYVSPPCDSVIVVTSTLESKGQTWEEKLFEQLQFGILGSLDKKERLLLHAAANHEDTEISQLKGQTTANVILRSGPSRESSRLDLVNTGRFVTILETEGRWHRVRFRNKIGWLYGGFVRLQSAKLKSKSARTNTYLNLRTGPGISYKVIRRLKPATSLTIKDQTGSWLLVQAESHEGWINRNYITFESPAAPVLVTLKDEASVTDKKVVVSKPGKQLASAGVETTKVIADVKEPKDVVERIYSRLEASEEQRQQLSGELDSIRRSWSAQRDAVDESTRVSKKLVTDMAESRQEIENLKQTVTDAQAGREKLNRELVQSRQEIEKLGKHLQESLSGRKKLTTEVSALRKELESRGAAKVTSAVERKKLVTDMAESRQEIENLKQTVTDAQAGREKLNRELVQSRQEIEKLGKHLQESLSGRKKLTTEVSALRKELESRGAAKVTSAVERKKLVTDMAESRQEIENLKQTVTDAQAGREKLNRELVQSRQEIEKLGKHLQESLSGRKKLTTEVSALRKELESRGAAKVTSAVERKKLVTDMAESRQEIENLKQTVTDAQAGREKLNRELVQSRQEIEKLGKHLQESLSGRKKLTTEVSALRKELESRGAAKVTSAVERKKLVTDMAESRQEIENLKQTVTDAQAGREKLNRELVQSRQEIEKLGKHLQESLSGRKKLTTEVSALRKELESQRKLTAESVADRKNLVSNLSSDRGQIASLEKALKDSQDSHKKNLAEMAKIYPELESQRKATGHLESAQNMLVSKLSSANEQISKLNKELQNFQKGRNDLVARIAKLDQGLNTRPKARVPQKKTTPASKKIASRTSEKSPFHRPDAASIDKFLLSWTDAWSCKDVGGYLSHYSLTYRPIGGMGFKKWRQQRQKSLERPAFIEVVVERVKKEMKDTGRAKVTFLQHYRSDLHTDSVMKTLDLIWEEDGWKIIKEKSKLIKLKFMGF